MAEAVSVIAGCMESFVLSLYRWCIVNDGITLTVSSSPAHTFTKSAVSVNRKLLYS